MVDGSDTGIEEKITEISMRADAYIPYGGGGAFASARLGDWFVQRKKPELPALNLKSYSDTIQRGLALLTVEGYIPATPDADYGISFRDFSSAAVVIPADQFLTMELVSQWVTRLLGQYQTVTNIFAAQQTLIR